ncbi:Protein ECM25 [Spathaspora sp. JA1]|nr:Protein ECM25 [Spathaspora sp. JA1]
MDRIFYRTSVRDPITNYPLYIFDTSYLPSPELINYDELIITLMNNIPTQPYVLIMFNCGLNKISWMWGIKFLTTFLDVDDYNLNNVVKIFTVHDSWFIKSLTEVVSNFNSTRKNITQFKKLLDMFDISSGGNNTTTEIVKCPGLAKLSHYLDITKLKISLNVYLHDLQIYPQGIELAMRYTPIVNPLIRLDKTSLFYHHLYQMFNIISTNGHQFELILLKPGNKAQSSILYDCIVRNHVIWINDFNLYCIANVFKKLLSQLPFALISVDDIPLPVKDDLGYSRSTLSSIITKLRKQEETYNYDQLLLQIFVMGDKLIENNQITKHTAITLSNCLGHCISHELITNNINNLQIVKRFIKNILRNWHDIQDEYKILTIAESIETTDISEPLYHSSTDTLITTPEISKVEIQYPPQKYKFIKEPTESGVQRTESCSRQQTQQPTESDIQSTHASTEQPTEPTQICTKQQTVTTKQQTPPTKQPTPPSKKTPPPHIRYKPVIRGRKVEQLTKLYEERSKGLEILNMM